MTSCLVDLHVWTIKNQTIIPDLDIGCFSYHDKSEGASAEHPYLEEKAYYTKSRDVTWTPKNKWQEKVKDTLKEAEDLLSQSRCVSSQWLSRQLLQIILATGTVIIFQVSSHTGDVDKILIDKSLTGKLSGDNPSDVLLAENYLVFCYPDKVKMDYVYLMKKPEIIKKIEKISAYEPKISQVDLIGPVGKRLERKLSCSLHEDIVLVWWATSSYEAWPWSPMTSDKERANLLLYAVNGPKIELIAYTRTECDPVGISYSLVHYHQIFSLEQSILTGGDISADICIYECSRSKITKYSTTSIPVQSNVKCYCRNPSEDKVVFGCEDGSLVLYDDYRKNRKTIHTSLIAHSIAWHPSGLFVFISSHKGEIQIYDLALSLLNIMTASESGVPARSLELGVYFRSVPVVSHMLWSPAIDIREDKMAECLDQLFIMFEKGPMLQLQFYLGVMSQGQLSPLSLVNQYIKHRQLDEAVGVLSSLKWNLEGQTCFACLSAIVHHLLREALNTEREAQLEMTLGTFYAPTKPLSDVTVLEYRDSMSRLARRFFHHLLRYARFEKAFLLAVDIGARDLFMDIHYLAQDKGEQALAEVAKQKADEIEADCLARSDMYDDGDDDDESVDIRQSDEEEGSDAGAYSSDEEYHYKNVRGGGRTGTVTPPRPPPRDGVPQIGSLGSGKALPPLPQDSRSNVNQYVNTTVDPRFNRQSTASVQGTSDVNRNSNTALADSRVLRGTYVNAAEILLQNAESNIALNKGPNEYLSALGEDDTIIPPPPSHADRNTTTTRGSAADAPQHHKKSSTLKVIHFGIV